MLYHQGSKKFKNKFGLALSTVIFLIYTRKKHWFKKGGQDECYLRESGGQLDYYNYNW